MPLQSTLLAYFSFGNFFSGIFGAISSLDAYRSDYRFKWEFSMSIIRFNILHKKRNSRQKDLVVSKYSAFQYNNAPPFFHFHLVTFEIWMWRRAKEGKHGEGGWPNSCYVVSKVGVSALSRIQQMQFLQDPRADIVLNHVHPGYVDTDMSSHKGPLTVQQGLTSSSFLLWGTIFAQVVVNMPNWSIKMLSFR